jgi:hypothetical protein
MNDDPPGVAPARCGSVGQPEVVPVRVVFESVHNGTIVRVLLLTAHSARDIVDLVLCDRGARSLTVLFPANAEETALIWAQSQFSWLRGRGVAVRVERYPRAAGETSGHDRP